MKKYFTIVLFTILSLACTSDDESNKSDEVFLNSIRVSGTAYNISNVYVLDHNTTDNGLSDISIIMSNIDLFEDSQDRGVNYIKFDFEGIRLEQGTLTNISKYEFLVDASYTNFEITQGETILNDSMNDFQAADIVVSIDFITNNNIVFDFSFLRTDGTAVTGDYSGKYTDISEE